MFIDIHTHITYNNFSSFYKKMQRNPFTISTLLKKMDEDGIEKSVLLPIDNPESSYLVAGTFECIKMARKYPDRIMTFCSLDPRSLYNTPKADFSRILSAFKDMGCLGVGELCGNLPVTHKLYRNLFYHAGKVKMPILFHLTNRLDATYGVYDKISLPGLEKVVKEFPETIFIGHASSFWNEIDVRIDCRRRNEYQRTPVVGEGRLCELLEKYPNLYGDLSAGSGYNAVSRTPEFGYNFLNKFKNKLFFGTDRFTRYDEPSPSIIRFIGEAYRQRKIAKATYENITHGNFERIFLRK